MKRVFPAPLMSLLLFIIWPVMNLSFSLGHLVLGACLAIAIPWFTEPLRHERARIRHWGTVVKLGLVVLYDIVMSNIDVARRILGPESRIKPAYVWVPLSIRDPHGVVALAGIITMTPGTLSADLSDDRRHLLVHGFHVEDEAGLIDSIKTRYEQPLISIFESEPAP
jgi:multicomponent K+:H+ antiporter subunit E